MPNNSAKANIKLPSTLFDKLWESHEIIRREDGQSLLWIDRHFLHEGSFHAFDQLRAKGVKAAHPDLSFGIADHYVPTRHRGEPIADPAIAHMVRQLSENTSANGITLFGLGDPRQGIVHVVGPEQGLTLPGLSIVCGDSHTSTHGAFGALAIGIGASEVAHVLTTQTLWQTKPKRMRVTVEHELSAAISAKDVILSIITRIGADGGRGYAIEYAGSAIRELSMEGRLTLCNMSIECGARCGMVAPDEKTIEYLRGRPFAPQGTDFDQAAAEWLSLRSDSDAVFDRELTLDAASLAPVVTWGTSPEDALPIDGRVPDPAREPDPARAAYVRGAIEYMGLKPGQPLTKVPGLISPGSSGVKRQAEEEGLDRIFKEAQLEWVDSGCSMCVGINGDLVPPGERCASTTNRNLRGRQGTGARTHLMSPAMVAAAAVEGHLADVRPLLAERTR